MSTNDWAKDFKKVYDRGVTAWNNGRNTPELMFNAHDLAILDQIGCTAQELFDFVDDAMQYDDLDYKTALAVANVRRDYFLEVMKGKYTGRTVPMDQLPAKTDQVDGITWLPRLIVKARIKLRGEMPPELMYGCAGDRPFLRNMKMDLAGFLKLVWECGEDDRRIVDAVKKSRDSAK